MYLTLEKQDRSTTIQNKSEKCLTEKTRDSQQRTGYYSELCNYERYGDNTVLNCSQHQEDLQPFIREEVEIAVAALKRGKSAEIL